MRAVNVPRGAPVRAGLRQLKSVRIAVFAVLLLSGALLIGALVPQVPVGISDRPQPLAAWLEIQRAQYGQLTDPLYRLGLFNVFHAWWFFALLGWLALSITVCTWSRVPALWRNAFSPYERIPEALFDRAAAQSLPPSTDEATLVRALRRRHFGVRRQTERGATYLFADRHAWAALGTVATHIGLVILLAGGLVSWLNAFDATLTVAEGGLAPALPLGAEVPILVGVERAVGTFDETGRPLDYRSDLVLYERGEEVKRCTITVNEPCSLSGYRFHQAGFFGYGAELVVRDITTGNTVHHEVHALNRSMIAPEVTVRDQAGAIRFSGPVPQTDVVGESLGALIPIPGVASPFWLGLREGAGGEWVLAVFDPSDGADGDRAIISLNGEATVAGLTFHFDRVTALPSLVTTVVPLAIVSAVPADQGDVLLLMENATFGTTVPSGDDAAGGGATGEAPTDGPPRLHLVGIAPVTVRLEPGETVRVGSYEYEFVGPRNYAGIVVRRDPGVPLVWAGTLLFLLGLTSTLWLPRNRAWFRLAEGRARMYSPGRTAIDAASLIDEPPLRAG